MFTTWFEANKTYVDGKDLTYAEFPSKFVYISQQRKWQLRKRCFNIGRLTYVSLGTRELYYMRIILTIQRGCNDHESINKVNGKTYNTFQEACYALGLLADDKKFIDGIIEASQFAFGNQLRRLFVTLLIMNTISKDDVVWNSTWKLLSGDILYQKRKSLNLLGFQIGESDLHNLCLIEVEKLLMSNGRSLKDYICLLQPKFSNYFMFENRFIVDELNYDKNEMSKLHYSFFHLLTEEQLHVYEEITTTIYCQAEKFFFLYGCGGTRTTFIWKTLFVAIWSQYMIVFNVASSGITSLLLPEGRTTHSTFCIPLIINEESTCNIAKGSLRAKLLIETKLIIWDEAIVMNKLCFEAFDRTLMDLMRIQGEENHDKPFGGKVVVLGGDFRQILPIVMKRSRQDVIKAAFNFSETWKTCKVLKLTENMKLNSARTCEIANEIKEFAD